MERSKIARMLPLEVRQEIEQRWRSGEFTIDELLAWLRERKPEADISRTGLGRHLAKYKHTFDRIREAQEVAGHCIEQLGENPRGDIARMLPQLLGALALGTLKDMEEKEAPPETKDLFFLANAIKNIASAEKTSVDRELKIRKELKAELEKKVDEMAKSNRATSGDLTPETFAKARELVLGLL
jgi:hypothetical protein